MQVEYFRQTVAAKKIQRLFQAYVYYKRMQKLTKDLSADKRRK